MTVSPLIQPEPPAAFDEFYRQYFVRVLALIRTCFSDCDAEEIAQETMARCYVKFDELDPYRDPWHWVSSIARHAAIDSLRRNRKLVSTDELPEAARDADDTTYDAVVVLERHRVLRTALRRLRPADRQLIVDHELEGLAYSEMAALRDITTNALRQKLFRARLRLASELRRAGGALGVLPVAFHHRFGKAARRAGDFSFTAGPAGASAFSVMAVAGVATVVTVLGGAGGTPSAAAGDRAGGNPVLAVERDARAVRRAVAAPARAAVQQAAPRPAAARTGPGPGSLPPVPTIVVNRQGDPINNPGEESRNEVRVPTPVGDVVVTTYDERTPGYGAMCLAGLIKDCPAEA